MRRALNGKNWRLCVRTRTCRRELSMYLNPLVSSGETRGESPRWSLNRHLFLAKNRGPLNRREFNPNDEQSSRILPTFPREGRGGGEGDLVPVTWSSWTLKKRPRSWRDRSPLERIYANTRFTRTSIHQQQPARSPR